MSAMTFVERRGREARGDLDLVAVDEHRLVRVVEAPDHPVETDPGEAVLALQLVAALDHQHDVDVGLHDRSGELGVAAGEADVDRARGGGRGRTPRGRGRR